MTKLFRRILVPHDFSKPADRALAVAADLARDAGGRLTVLHALVPYPVTGLTPAEGVPFIAPRDLVKPALARLRETVREALGRRAPAFVCRVVVGDPARRIIEAARNADSVVMATEGRTGLTHLLIGSVAEKVVRQSPRPVLTVRARVRAVTRARHPSRAASRRRRRAARRA
jgi:nucleotide-binding universal stress UspA family protein